MLVLPCSTKLNAHIKGAPFMLSRFASAVATITLLHFGSAHAQMSNDASSRGFALSSAESVQRNFNQGSCTPFLDGSGVSPDKVRLAIDGALRTATYNANGTVKSFELNGRSFEPRYEGSKVLGYVVDQKSYFSLSIDNPSTLDTSTSFYVRDNAGVLQGFVKIDRNAFSEWALSAFSHEETLNRNSAAAELDKRQLQRVQPTVPRKFDGDWDTNAFKPCVVCDVDLAIELGQCGLTAGLIGGAGVAVTAAGCLSPGAPISCPAGIVIGGAVVLSGYEYYQLCTEWARFKHGQCRQTCT
jgi:hypothetical protein